MHAERKSSNITGDEIVIGGSTWKVNDVLLGMPAFRGQVKSPLAHTLGCLRSTACFKDQTMAHTRATAVSASTSAKDALKSTHKHVKINEQGNKRGQLYLQPNDKD